MKKYNLALDLDDCVAPFVENWLEWLYEKNYTSTLFDRTKVTHYSWFEDTFGSQVNDFYLLNPDIAYESNYPFDGAVEFVEWCKNKFDDIQFVTHSSNKKSSEAKTNFIKKHFGDISVQCVSDMNGKYKYTKDSILVDDYPLHLINHLHHNNSPAVLFNKERLNGWSCLSNYKHIIKEKNVDMSLFSSASNYRTLKQTLESYL